MIGDAATNVSRQGPVGALRGPWGPVVLDPGLCKAALARIQNDDLIWI